MNFFLMWPNTLVYVNWGYGAHIAPFSFQNVSLPFFSVSLSLKCQNNLKLKYYFITIQKYFTWTSKMFTHYVVCGQSQFISHAEEVSNEMFSETLSIKVLNFIVDHEKFYTGPSGLSSLDPLVPWPPTCPPPYPSPPPTCPFFPRPTKIYPISWEIPERFTKSWVIAPSKLCTRNAVHILIVCRTANNYGLCGNKILTLLSQPLEMFVKEIPNPPLCFN